LCEFVDIVVQSHRLNSQEVFPNDTTVSEKEKGAALRAAPFAVPLEYSYFEPRYFEP
jgi:hypothetical protein